MKKILLAFALCLLPTLASAQCSGIFTAGNVCGTLSGGPPKQVPITSFPPFASANANTVYAGPTSGPAAAPAFRSLVGADLPLPTTITLGAVFSKTATASNWLRSLGTDGIFTISQPAFTDISGQASLAQLPTIAADTALGNWSGGSAVPSATAMPNCTGALNYSTSTHTFSCNTSSVPNAPDQVSNCSLAATVSGNALTIALKDQTGADPSANSSCLVSFRSATAATGTYTTVSVASALSFSTGTTGSTFGSSNSVPFRLWITAWNNAGTLVLGVSKQSTSTAVFPINEGAVQSSTACSACTTASSSGVFYTTAAQTSKAIRILGYMDWESGLATAGVWASGPTTIQMFGAGVLKPGQVVQTVAPAFGTLTVVTFTGVLTATNVTANITPLSAINLVKYQATVGVQNGSSSDGCNMQMYRGTTAIGAVLKQLNGTGTNIGTPNFVGYDNPASTSAQTYVIKGIQSVGGTCSVPVVNTDSATEILEEIQG